MPIPKPFRIPFRIGLIAPVPGCILGLALALNAAADPGYKLEIFPPDSGAAPRDSANSKAVRSDTAYLEPLSAYAQVRSASFQGWADTGIYISTQMGKYPQAHQVASPGADRRQLTFFPRRCSGFYFNPVPERKNFLFTVDEGGNEEFRIRLHDLRTGTDRDLGAPPGRVEGIVWNDSGTAFAYSHTPVGTDRWDLRLGRPDGRDTLLLSLPGTWSALDVRPDGKRLLAQKYVSASQSELFVLDLTDGKLTPLLPGEKPAYADDAQWIRTPAWSRKAGALKEGARLAGATKLSEDASWSVVFTSDRDGEFHRLYWIGPDSGAKPLALSHAAAWDVEWASLDPERRGLVYSLNEEGYSKLYYLAPDEVKSRALANIPAGIISAPVFKPGPWTAGGGRPGAGRPGAGRKPAGAGIFAFTINNAAFPADAYVYDLAKSKATRWTRSEPGGLPESSFRTPELIRYPAFDSLPSVKIGSDTAAEVRRTIPAWLYRPDAAAFPGPRPTLIAIHGGPEGQSRPGFDAFLQYLVGRLGFIVIQPNVRGSTGYGRAWQQADDGYLRMNSVRDLGALIDWIGTRSAEDGRAAEESRTGKGGPGPGNWPDPSRLAVSGRSYGGFMSLSALIEYGPKLRAGVDIVGITHFPTFLKKTSGYRRDLRRVEYGDERNPRMAAFLDSISPLTRMDRIRTPLLLCHGRNDPRVPYEESQRIFAALKGRKIPTWFLTFTEEGHAVRDQDSQLVQWRTTAEFLMRELGAPAPASGAPSPVPH